MQPVFAVQYNSHRHQLRLSGVGASHGAHPTHSSCLRTAARARASVREAVTWRFPMRTMRVDDAARGTLRWASLLRAAAIEADALVTLSTLLTASTVATSASTVQLTYQTLFSLWSLSYSPEAALEMASSKLGLIAKLVEIVKTSPKEKVIRVALSTLRNLLGIGSAPNDMVVFGLMPVLEAAGVNLVHNGHSHLWNRFVSAEGVNYLEASNTGNSYGAFLPVAGNTRPIPPSPWDAANYAAQGNPGGLEPVVPTLAPLRDPDGRPLPYVADNDFVVFQALHTGTGVVTSWYVDLTDSRSGAVRFDEFSLGPPVR